MGHMHLHSDSKPFKCLYCQSKFTLKGNLTRHMKVKHGVMDRGLDERRKCVHTDDDVHCLCILANFVVKCNFFSPVISVFRQRGRFCLTTPMDLLTHFSQEEPFDLSQKPPGLPSLRLSQSDGESVPGSSCQEEEDEESLYRRSQYSPEVDHHEPAADQYIPELEERRQGSPGEPREGKRQKQQKYQESLEDETFERKSVAEGQSKVPRCNKAQLLESETSCESDAELGEQVCRQKMVRRQSYEYDSEEEAHQQEVDEPEQRKEKLDNFHKAIDVEETNKYECIAQRVYGSNGEEDKHEEK